MLRLWRRQREILYARIDIGKITVRTAHRTEAVIRMGIHDDPVRKLGAAGYTVVRRGFPPGVLNFPYTVLVRRRLRRPGSRPGILSACQSAMSSVNRWSRAAPIR